LPAHIMSLNSDLERDFCLRFPLLSQVTTHNSPRLNRILLIRSFEHSGGQNLSREIRSRGQVSTYKETAAVLKPQINS
ncbi:hypothetical protein, partial [Arcanobacterium phocae]|uniref:hypothetical protein n=2 Tax=Arcanobacterium phocae TaxID=131112 RepID=UPI001C0EA90C